MNILYYTYPWAMDLMGGGERQMLSYMTHLERYSIFAKKFNMWEPVFDNFSIFHCFSVMPGIAEICNYVKKEKGMRLVISPNLWITRETKSNYPFEYIWNLFEIADAIIVNSDMEGNELSHVFSTERQKFHTIYNGVEADFLVPESCELFKNHSGIGEPYVLNIANVEPRKNQLAFLQAMRQVLPEHKFVVIGAVRDRHYHDECVKLAGSSYINLGPYPYASQLIRSALAGCEFFAMPSMLETPSIAALEAAASGAKILITNVGSTTEYFGPTVPYLNPWDHETMAEGIRCAIKSSGEDSTWRVRSSYLWTKIMPSLADFYRQLGNR